MHSRLLRCTLASLTLVVTTGALAAGCLSRPVVPGEPTTKTNFTTSIQEQAVDKLDILFSIDNSASMGDKQVFLEQAIPDLINRLVTPNCLDNVTGAVTGLSDDTGKCAASTSTVEFTPVHDMHIGIVSSSLGPRLGNACPANGTTTLSTGSVPDHNDDQAHLIARTAASGAGADPTEGTITDTGSNNFLAWLPGIPANSGRVPPTGNQPIVDPVQLSTDFTDMVAGVHQFGCGIESQLENWYRFLIQPDPYASLATGATPAGGGVPPAEWVGVDTTILAQRRAFLRPDSLVAIIVLTDENDSEIDVRSIAGQGYQWMSTNFNPPMATAACLNTPGDPTCESCAVTGSGCSGKYTAVNDWGMDLNLRHVHMKAKYGLDPQFPINRYVNGLTSGVVPDRVGEYPSGAQSYVGKNDCVNPLFAAALPDPTKLSANIATAPTAADAKALCNLTPGTRSPSLVFYTIIGGVPYQYLHYDQTTGVANITDADWVTILGKDPVNYDYTGIDPHMVESYQPRAGLSTTGTDAINGREWITNLPIGVHKDLAVDREYACIFPITPRDCTNPDNALACDCSTATGLTPEQTSPVCDPNLVTNQIAAKAYPTIRELEVARALGKQGIASSICPQDTSTITSPVYGYRPAVASIIARLKDALTNQCLPQKLNPDATGKVPCLILATLGEVGDESKCTGGGLSVPDATVLAQFRASQEAAYKANGGGQTGSALPDPATFPVCEVAQIVEPGGSSCKGGTDQGWCYVTGTAAGTTCSQAILFTDNTPPTGSTISLECIETSAAISDAGAAQTGD